MKRTFLSLTLALAIAHEALAQEAQPLPDSAMASDSIRYFLKPVLVTATRSEQIIYRVPYALDLIAQRDLQRAEVGLSLDEALRALPGVVVNNRYNLSQGDRITIRGIGSRTPFGVRGIKIILDGIPLTMPDGQSQLNNLDLGSAGKIEIIRGPSSSLYGNAAGGLINIQTQSVQTIPIRMQPQFIAGSNGLRKWQAKFSGKIGKQAYLINVSKLQFAGHRQHAAAGSVSLNAIGRHEISKRFSLTTVFNYFDAPYLLNPGALSKTEAETSPTTTRFLIKQQGAGKKIEQGQAGITFKYGASAADQFEATLYGLSRSLLNPIPGRIIELDRAAGGMRAVFNKQFSFGSSLWRWTIGADYEAQYDARVEFQNRGIPPEQTGVIAADKIFSALQYGPVLLDQKERVIGAGPFSELQWEIGQDWAMTLGARYDRYQLKVSDHFVADGADDSGVRNMDQLSPMIGLAYHPHPVLTTYMNYSTAFQIPTTTELSNRPMGEGGFNPDLNPETMRSFEVGLKGSWPQMRLDYDFALYRYDIEDMLISYQIPEAGSEEVFFRNAGKARNQGVEMKFQWMPSPGLRASFAYTFMSFRFEDFLLQASSGNAPGFVQLAGRKVPGVLPQRFFAGMIYEHGSGAYAEINWQRVGQYFTSDFNGPPPGSSKPLRDFINAAYQVTDLRVGWQGRYQGIGGEIFGGSNNVFDARYNGSIVPNASGDRFFEPAARRSWYAGVNVAFSKN